MFFSTNRFLIHIVKNTGSRLRKHLLLKDISHTSQKPFLTNGSGYNRDLPSLRTIAFLICEASTVFLKNKLFLHVRAALSRNRFTRCCNAGNYPCVLLFVPVDSIRAQRLNRPRIGLIAVLCHSSCLIYRRSPAPAAFYFASNSACILSLHP